RDHLVLGALLDGEDARNVHPRLLADPRHRIGRDATAAGVGFAHGELHPEPRPVLELLGPQAAHLRARVTLDHALTLEQNAAERKCLRRAGGPSRGACRRCERAAGSLEARVGGWGGHPGPRPPKAAGAGALRTGGWGGAAWGAGGGGWGGHLGAPQSNDAGARAVGSGDRGAPAWSGRGGPRRGAR